MNGSRFITPDESEIVAELVKKRTSSMQQFQNSVTRLGSGTLGSNTPGASMQEEEPAALSSYVQILLQDKFVLYANLYYVCMCMHITVGPVHNY